MVCFVVWCSYQGVVLFSSHAPPGANPRVPHAPQLRHAHQASFTPGCEKYGSRNGLKSQYRHGDRRVTEMAPGAAFNSSARSVARGQCCDGTPHLGHRRQTRSRFSGRQVTTVALRPNGTFHTSQGCNPWNKRTVIRVLKGRVMHRNAVFINAPWPNSASPNMSRPFRTGSQESDTRGYAPGWYEPSRWDEIFPQLLRQGNC